MLSSVMGAKNTIKARWKEARKDYSREEYIEFLSDLARGEITETKSTAAGDTYEACALSERQRAAKELATVSGWRVVVETESLDKSNHTVSFLPRPPGVVSSDEYGEEERASE